MSYSFNGDAADYVKRRKEAIDRANQHAFNLGVRLTMQGADEMESLHKDLKAHADQAVKQQQEADRDYKSNLERLYDIYRSQVEQTDRHYQDCMNMMGELTRPHQTEIGDYDFSESGSYDPYSDSFAPSQSDRDRLEALYRQNP